ATWDVSIGNLNLSHFGSKDYARLRADSFVAGLTAVAAPQGTGSIDGRPVSVAGLDQIAGHVGPHVVSGRLPVRKGEVALGQRTARSLHISIGDRVTVGYGDATRRVRV